MQPGLALSEHTAPPVTLQPRSETPTYTHPGWLRRRPEMGTYSSLEKPPTARQVTSNYPHFSNKEAGTQRGLVTCPRSHSCWSVEPGCERTTTTLQPP